MREQWPRFVVGTPSPRARLRPPWWLATITAGVVLAAVAWYGIRAGRESERLAHGARLVATAQYGAAVRTLLPVVAAAPGRPLGHYYLGLAYHGLGFPAAALTQIEEAVRLAPQDARLHAGLGESYRNAGQPARALAELEEAARRDPGNPRYPVAVAGILLDQAKAKEATEHLRAAVRLQPDAPELHGLLALALREAGNPEPAATECREGLRLADGTALAELVRRECRAGQLQHLTTQGGIHP
jgi:tetratricopeptide (TPR) repeat protein